MQSLNNTYCNNIGFDIVIFSALLSIILAKDLSVYDQNLLSVLLQSIGQNLAVTATIQGNCESNLQS